jgi:Ca2+-binding RTX toxin-like protein
MTNLISGTPGDDNLIGTIAADTFDLSQGGEDTAIGLDGNDVFEMGATLDAGDHIDGWTGSDTVILSGDYSAGLVLGVTTLVNVETISLTAGNSYNITSNDGTVATGQTLTVDASQLGAADTLTFDGSAETDGRFVFHAGQGQLIATGGALDDSFTGGAGDDVLTGGAGNDTFVDTGGNNTLSGGLDDDTFTVSGGGTNTINGDDGNDIINLAGTGSDTINGGDGNDTISVTGASSVAVNGGDGDDTLYFFGTLDPSDQVDGGTGDDTLVLNGNYGTSVIHLQNVTGIENIVLGPTSHAQIAQSYALAVDMGDEILTVDAHALHGNDSLNFTWGSDTLADEQTAYRFYGGGGTYMLEGANQNDSFHFHASGHGHLSFVAIGNGGDDVFHPGGTFNATDQIDGGSGNDTIFLEHSPAGGLILGPDTITNVETIRLEGASFDLTTNDNTVASGATLLIDGRHLHGALAFDGSAETDGVLRVFGGAGDDTIFGGAGNDVLNGGGGDNVYDGGGGADRITLSTGTDLLIYRSASESTSTGFDRVTGFDCASDQFDAFVRVTGIDASIATGSLSAATFDTDLASAVGSASLAPNHAVLFDPDAGDYRGQTFLVIDQNGTAGYQAGQDLVIELFHATNLGSFGLANFI